MGGDYMCLKEFEMIWKFWVKSILCPRSVLFVMNMQNDYLHGNLSKLNGNAVNSNIVIDKVNALLRMKEFELVIYVLESHPENHISFIDNIDKYKDVLWPCQDAKDLIESDRSREGYEMGTFQVWDKVSSATEGNRFADKIYCSHDFLRFFQIKIHHQNVSNVHVEYRSKNEQGGNSKTGAAHKSQNR